MDTAQKELTLTWVSESRLGVRRPLCVCSHLFLPLNESHSWSLLSSMQLALSPLPLSLESPLTLRWPRPITYPFSYILFHRGVAPQTLQQAAPLNGEEGDAAGNGCEQCAGGRFVAGGSRAAQGCGPARWVRCGAEELWLRDARGKVGEESWWTLDGVWGRRCNAASCFTAASF